MIRIWLAEFIGTFMVVFIGCGFLILNLPYAALAFGITVAIMIHFFGRISRAHFNPAVTIGFRLMKLMTTRAMIIYWSAEFAGALSASLLHALIFKHPHQFGMTISQLPNTETILLEFAGSFLLMTVIGFAVTKHWFKEKLAAPAIGGTVFLISQFIGPLTGGSFNPARSLAPAVMAASTGSLWIYFIATISGSATSALVLRWWNKGRK